MIKPSVFSTHFYTTLIFPTLPTLPTLPTNLSSFTHSTSYFYIDTLNNTSIITESKPLDLNITPNFNLAPFKHLTQLGTGRHGITYKISDNRCVKVSDKDLSYEFSMLEEAYLICPSIVPRPIKLSLIKEGESISEITKSNKESNKELNKEKIYLSHIELSVPKTSQLNSVRELHVLEMELFVPFLYRPKEEDYLIFKKRIKCLHKGIVHSDIKRPTKFSKESLFDNVIYTESGFKLIDFGGALSINDNESDIDIAEYDKYKKKDLDDIKELKNFYDSMSPV